MIDKFHFEDTLASMHMLGEFVSLLEEKSVLDDFPFLEDDNETTLLEADPADKGEEASKANTPDIGGNNVKGADVAGGDENANIGDLLRGDDKDKGTFGSDNQNNQPSDVDELSISEKFKAYISLIEIIKVLNIYVTLVDLLSRKRYNVRLFVFKKDLMRFKDTVEVLVANWNLVENKPTMLDKIKKLSLELDDTFLEILDEIQEYKLKEKLQKKIKKVKEQVKRVKVPESVDKIKGNKKSKEEKTSSSEKSEQEKILSKYFK